MTGWQAAAACAQPGTDPDQPWADPAAALALCAVCPVRAECAADAAQNEPRDWQWRYAGVRGGLTAAERRPAPEEMTRS